MHGIDFWDNPIFCTVVGKLAFLLWMACFALVPGHVGDQNCGCPVGDADISAVNIGTMYLKAYIGDHNSLFDLIIKRLMDS